MRKPITLVAGLTIALLLAISIFSGQIYDLDQTYSYAIELTNKGISTFNNGPQRTGVPMDYLPTLYLALRAIMIPTYLFKQNTINSLCAWDSTNPVDGCTDLIDSIYLKIFFTLSAIIISTIAVKRATKNAGGSSRSIKKSSVALALYFITTPTIFYSVYLFNGYDSIGILATIAGLLLFSREGKDREHKAKKKFFMTLFRYSNI